MILITTTVFLIAFLGPVISVSVNLAVYYESRCTDSRKFFLNQLSPTLNQLKSSINLELVPFGNEKVTTSSNSYHYSCQHGPTECWGNRVEACVLEQYGSVQTAYEYSKCMFEPENFKDVEAHARPCAQRLNLNWDRITTCVNGPESDRLMERFWKQTDGLQPKHTFIPWITVNGQGSATIEQQSLANLTNFLCSNYLPGTTECGNTGNSDYYSSRYLPPNFNRYNLNPFNAWGWNVSVYVQ